jgi:hypothetical protein
MKKTFYEIFLQNNSAGLTQLANEYLNKNDASKEDICKVLLSHYRIFSSNANPGIYTLMPKGINEKTYVLDAEDERMTLYERLGL